MDNLGYLFAAYTIVWIVIFLYVLAIDRRSRRAERDMEELRRLLGHDDERRDPSRPPPPPLPVGERSPRSGG